MIRLFRRLRNVFLPAGAELAMIALDDIAREACSRTMFSFVRPARNMIRLKKGQIHYAVLDGVPPKAIVYWIISDLAEGMLLSGTLHIYRGVLGVLGQPIYTLWQEAADKMVELDRWTTDAATISELNC